MPTPVFVFGCGRSGTTLIGELLQCHPDVRTFDERYDWWAVIHPATDCCDLYRRGQGRVFMTREDAGSDVLVRFDRLMRRRSTHPRSLVVDVNPGHATRLGFLDALAPNALFLNVVRDGLDVVHSIVRQAAKGRRIAGRPWLNNWWGSGDIKWDRLAREANLYPEHVGRIANDAERAAYEWLVSMHAVDGQRVRLGKRLLDVRYEDITSRREDGILKLAAFLGLRDPEAWTKTVLAYPMETRHNEGPPLRLPPEMAAGFNSFQARFEFTGRAVSSRGPTRSRTLRGREGRRPSAGQIAVSDALVLEHATRRVG